MSSASELAKERLAFVSGNILVFGLLFLRLWPAAATYQTRLNINFWTADLPGGDVKPELWIFQLMTLVLAAMASALFLAIFHILCWGILLGVSTELSESEESSLGQRRTQS